MINEVLLTSICRPKQWKTISTKELKDSGYPVYGANGKIGFYNSYTHETPTILITCRGATCGTINICEEKSYVNGNAMALDNLSKGVDMYFLKHFLEFRKLDDVISGSAQPQITGQGLSKIKIPLPPLATQQKIAAILDAADDLRQKDKALVAKYDELTQALFLDMFGDPVTNPKGWVIKTIEEITSSGKNSIKRGPFGGALKKEIFVEDGYLVYEQFHALNNDFTMARYFIDEKKFNELKGFEVKPGDIIISCSGIYLGKLAIIPKDAKKGIINQALLKIKLDEQKMRNDFFIFHFTQKNFKEKYFEANRGAGIPNFPPMPTFKKFPFIAPPIKLQNQFAERVKAIEEQKNIAQASALKSEELFNSLLQKAFNGELV
jgi:type I restriction enzyme S subunit